MKILSIQVLRALAAWMIVYHHFMQVIFHFDATNPVGDFFSEHGMFGVDVFFVISGFIMAFIAAEKGVSSGAFLRNRIVRIVPNYWIWTLIILLLGQGVLPGLSSAQATPESVVLSLLFVSHPNPDAALGYYPTLPVGWTLNFEMFFYVLFAVVLSRRWRIEKTLVATMALIVAIPVLYKLFHIGVYHQVLGNIKLFEFASGMGLFYLWRFGRNIFDHPLTLTIVVISIFPLAFFAQYGMVLVYFATVTLYLFLYLEKWRDMKNKVLRAFEHLGEISYSTYLAHGTVLALLDACCGGAALSAGGVVMLLAVYSVGVYAVSYASYRLVEVRLSKRLKG